MSNYNSLNNYLRQRFGHKVYKLALSGGMTCPNRDGTLGFGGCIFCSEGGSGDFAEQFTGDITAQIEAAKARVSAKMTDKDGKYIAYFQSFTNTYAPVAYLRRIFTEALRHPDIAALSIGTRPDCIGDDVLELLKELNQIKPVWVELGLQTIHEDTAKFIRRGYELRCFENTFARLKNAGLEVIVHVILGLPGETREDMLATVKYLADIHPDGIKLQLLHVLKGTDLADIYEANPFPVMDLDEYISLVIDCIRLLPPDMVIHRISGDGAKKLLIAPLWSGNKKLFINSFNKALADSKAYQGEWYLS